MSKFEMILTVVNILAIIIIPIAAVFIGQKLQEKSELRKDKMQIFQCLMTRRILGWASLEAVNALNSIDVIFADCEAVRKQWAVLLSKYSQDISPREQYGEQCKLLELMANDLGYATNNKEYKQNPELYKGNVATVCEFIRVALTGKKDSLDLFSIISTIGQEETEKRLAHFENLLK